MDLSIVIASYKNTESLRLCLVSLSKNKDLRFTTEMIVSDGETGESTSMMMREDFPDVIFLPHKRNIGFGALVRSGMEKATGAYVFIMNGDVIADQLNLYKMYRFMKKNHDIGMVGPQQLNYDGTLQYTCFRFYKIYTILFRRTFLQRLPSAKKHLDWFLMKDSDYDRIHDVDWLLGSALMVSRRAVDTVGTFDRRFFMYLEDTDWCRRFWENNFRVVYYPKASIYHFYGKGSARGSLFYSLFFNRLTRIHIVSAIKYFFKYFGKPLPR